MRLLPARRAVGKEVLLPHHYPDRALRVGHANELGGEPIERDALKCEAQDEAEPSVLRSERYPEIQHVELTGEVLERAVVGCDLTDTERGRARFHAQFGDDLDGGAHSARRFHRSLKSRERRMHEGRSWRSAWFRGRVRC